MAAQSDKERLNRQIADRIRAQIEDGTLAPGAEAPGENDIMRDYDVSRTTARLALGILKSEGLLEARQGTKTRVRAFTPIRRNATKRLAQEVWGSGRAIWDIDVPDRSHAVDVVVDEVDGPARILRAFGAAEGTRFCRRSRRFVIDDKPIMLAVSHLLADMVRGSAIIQVNTGEGGSYARLADLGHPPKQFREEIRVRMPSPDEKSQLALSAGTPVICIARTAATTDGAVVEVNEMILDSSSYLLEYDFSA
jgi:GntR family transcriptional regulator